MESMDVVVNIQNISLKLWLEMSKSSLRRANDLNLLLHLVCLVWTIGLLYNMLLTIEKVPRILKTSGFAERETILLSKTFK